jgi:hypothetical protein
MWFGKRLEDHLVERQLVGAGINCELPPLRRTMLAALVRVVTRGA